MGQECVKRGLLTFLDKIGTITLISLENESYSSFGPTFLPAPPKHLAFPPTQNLHFWIAPQQYLRSCYPNQLTTNTMQNFMFMRTKVFEIAGGPADPLV